PPFPSPALAFVHGLHPGDGNRMPLLDQVARQRLCLGHQISPWIAVADLPGDRVHGEVGWLYSPELIPGHREGHGRARPDARAVRGRDRSAAGSGRVDEHLAVPVLLDEGSRRQGWVDPLGAAGEWSGYLVDILVSLV